MMHNESSSDHLQEQGWLARLRGFTSTMPGMIVAMIAIMAVVYLIFAQLELGLPVLPLVLLVHLFMHRGHGRHGDQSGHRH